MPVNTKFNILANTGVLNLGAQSVRKNQWGWTGGAGIEYALDEHRIAVNQTFNLFKLSLNYKFDCF